MLKVNWWRPDNGGFNLGDELTSHLLDHFFGVAHAHASRADAELMSTGSILQWLWDKPEMAARQTPIAVVGSGAMHPWLPYDRPMPAIIHSVRGYLTRHLLGDWAGADILLGDPGLLAAAGHHVPRRIRHRYGVIPHLSSIHSPAFAAHFQPLDDYTIIDFRTRDVPAVLEQIASCEIIVSQGLHGLILADALGVPNAWLNPGPIHRASTFKFHDYFSTVGRRFDAAAVRLPVSRKDIEAAVVDTDRARVRDAQNQVVEAFSRFFRAEQINFQVPEF